MQTYNVKIEFENLSEKTRMDKTLCLQTDCWNLISYLYYEYKPKNVKEIHELTYKKSRESFPDLPAQYVIRTYNDVKATYKTIKSNKHKIKKACVKKKHSVRLDKRLYSIKGNSVLITACDGKKIQFNFNPYSKLQEFLDKKVPCDPLIFEKDGQYWLSLSFKSEEIPVKHNKVLGVDLGEKRLYATSEDEIFIDKKFNKERRKLRFLKRQCQSKKTKASRQKLKKLKNKERNKTKNQVHKVANKILKTDANIISLEDLRGIKQKTSAKNKEKGNFGKKRNNKFSQVPLAELRTTLQYKAGLLGKEVVLVSPAFTSQDDYRGLKRGKRCKTRYYASDGVILDSDVNAAINIAKKHADKHKLPVSLGNFKIAGLDGQANVNRPEEKSDLCKSCGINFTSITSPEALAQGS